MNRVIFLRIDLGQIFEIGRRAIGPFGLWLQGAPEANVVNLALELAPFFDAVWWLT